MTTDALRWGLTATGQLDAVRLIKQRSDLSAHIVFVLMQRIDEGCTSDDLERITGRRTTVLRPLLRQLVHEGVIEEYVI